MDSYQFVANENHAAMKKIQLTNTNQEDSHMNTSFDQELSSSDLSNGFSINLSSPEFHANLNHHQVASQVTARHI